MKHVVFFAVIVVSVAICQPSASGDPYDPPAGYYDSATGTGLTLKSQLTTIMTSGHIQRSYGDFRFSAALTDADPNAAGNILLVYNLASVSATWDSGVTWNREHVWPQSRQPGSASNSSTGNLGDPHALRPANPSINSARGNKPFGSFGTTGAFGSLGTFYFPGDADKGDIARNLFYSATRWSSLGLTLVNGVPSGNQMGDLDSAIRWNYTDPPGEFERRRNQTIYSAILNPTYRTNNRNAYIDHPEFVWSVFGSFDNDSTLYVGGIPAADGSSAMLFDFGRVIVGGTAPADQLVNLDKDGTAPTYYEVALSGDATSTDAGRYNAFDFNPQSTSLNVGLAASTAVAGVQAGTVTINNLDVSSGGAGQGSADADDIITLQLAVLSPAQGSFSNSSLLSSTTASFAFVPGTGSQMIDVDVHNFGFNADQSLLDLDGISGDVLPFGYVSGLQTDIGATPATLTFSFDTDGTPSGVYSTPIDIDVSDEDVSGEALGLMSITLDVTLVGTNGDWNSDGNIDSQDYLNFFECLVGPGTPASSVCVATFDADVDGDVDLDDFESFQAAFTGP